MSLRNQNPAQSKCQQDCRPQNASGQLGIQLGNAGVRRRRVRLGSCNRGAHAGDDVLGVPRKALYRSDQPQPVAVMIYVDDVPGATVVEPEVPIPPPPWSIVTLVLPNTLPQLRMEFCPL